jgi:hypothetical protein
MATLAEVSDGMTQVNGEPMPDICYVAARGGHQIDSGDQLLRDVAVAWADEDKGKCFLIQLDPTSSSSSSSTPVASRSAMLRG